MLKAETNDKAKIERPFANSPIAIFLREKIDHGEKSQREIAADIGYDKPNIVSMFKRGDAKVPLDKIPALAQSLDVDVGHFFRLALEQYWPNLNDIVDEIFGNTVSHNEMEWVRKIRQASNNMDPAMSPDQGERLAAVVKKKI